MQSAFGVEHGEIYKSVARGIKQVQNISTRTVFPVGTKKTPARVLQAQRKVGENSKRAANKLRGDQHRKFLDSWGEYEAPKSPLANMPKYGA